MSCAKHALIDSTGRFSSAIATLTRIAKGLDYQVEHSDGDYHRWGRCDYKTRIISTYIPCAGCTLITLAHEVGHALHYEAGWTYEDREEQAEARGWGLLVALGMTDLVTAEEWAEHHVPEPEEPGEPLEEASEE